MKTAPSFQPVVELSLPAHLRANGSHLDSWMKTMYGLIEQDRLIWDCYQHHGFPDTKSPRSLSNLGYSKALSSFSPSI